MGPSLIFITDSERFGWTTTERVARTLCETSRAGAVAVLLREPFTNTSLLIRQAEQLRRTTAQSNQLLFVRDRWDIALWVRADGVHLGEHSAPASEVRQALAQFAPPAHSQVYISRAWHAIDETPEPAAQLLLVSPVAATRKGLPALGRVGLTHAVVRAEGRPVYALGGIEADDVGWIHACGAAGIAVIGSAYRDPLQLVRASSALRS